MNMQATNLSFKACIIRKLIVTYAYFQKCNSLGDFKGIPPPPSAHAGPHPSHHNLVVAAGPRSPSVGSRTLCGVERSSGVQYALGLVLGAHLGFFLHSQSWRPQAGFPRPVT